MLSIRLVRLTAEEKKRWEYSNVVFLTMWTRYRMLMPRDMKGLEKSMTFSLSEVMVKPATARSAFCLHEKERERETEREREGEEEKREIEQGTTIHETSVSNYCSAYHHENH